MTAAASDTLPSFARPPLIEVVCGVTFQQIDALLVPHFGLLWAEKFRADYPNLKDVDPLLPVIERFEGQPQEDPRFLEFATLPRVWFVDAADNAIVQVQRDRFLHNWKKVRPEDEYPRYGRVSEMFFERLKRFSDFLQERDLPGFDPKQYELTYINHIPQGQGWESLADIGRLFPDFSWRATTRKMFPAPTSINWATSFDFPAKNGRLRATLTVGVSKRDNRLLLALDLTARGFGDDKSLEGMRAWFDQAHKVVVNTFVDLTAKDAREGLWGEAR